MDEAVRMALENNLGIQQERLNPQIQTLGVARASAAFTPELFSTISRRNSTAPPTDFLSTGTGNLPVTATNFASQAGVQQVLPFGGSNYAVSCDGSRDVTDRPLAVFSPQLGSHLNAQFTQPLLRNFKIDALRQQVLLAHNQQRVADIQLRQRITQTSRNVRGGYYTWSVRLPGSTSRSSRSSSRVSRCKQQPDPRGGRHDGADRHRRRARPRWQATRKTSSSRKRRFRAHRICCAR